MPGRVYRTRAEVTQTLTAEVHEGMRRRLRTLRLSRNMATKDFRTMAPGTLTQYELHDLTTISLGALISLADEFSMEPLEFMRYLFGEQTIFPRSGPTRNLDEIGVYLRDSPEAVQELCVSVVRAIVQHERNAPTENLVRRLISRDNHPEKAQSTNT